MKQSIIGLRLITHFEGLVLEAYLCPADVWTVGYGTTIYPNGKRVKEGDVCTKEEAEAYLADDVARRCEAIGELPVNQNQYDAIISFVYNVGLANWNNSTLRRKIKKNPTDTTIKDEFLRWVYKTKKGVKVEVDGLRNRRKAEAELYFK